MSTNQFPPSSPFLDHHQEDDADPFSSKNAQQSKKFIINSPFNKEPLNNAIKGYPTPNPSSSTGVRSSSPARANREPSDLLETQHQQQNEELTVEYKDPLQDVLKAKISFNHTTTLGRSSRCDYFIKSKYASRVHLKLQYNADSNELTILCKGFNGVVVNFGTEVYGYVKQVSNKLYYFQKIPQFEIKSNDEIFHDVSLFRDEQITVPYLDSLTLNIKGHITKLDVESDDSETEDELPVLNTRYSSVEPSKEHPAMEKIGVELGVAKEVKIKDSVEKMEIEEKSVKPVAKTIEPVKEVSVEETSKSVEEPRSRSRSRSSSTSSVKSGSKSVETTKHTTRKLATASPSPLQPKSESSLNKQNNQSRPRIRKAEPGLSPQKKKQHQQPKEKISQLDIKSIIKTVPDLANVSNILINHLAFSRLSQTPLYQLQTVSATTQELSRTQLRAILFQIECIGTIYRQGKDAAGKPLDEEYYYDSARDTDEGRKQLVGSVKGAGGLRNCRKTHKQYFWKKPTK